MATIECMTRSQPKSFSKIANETAGTWAHRIDDQTGEVAHRAARVIAVSVRALRIPTAIIWAIPVPFIVLVLFLSVMADGGARVIGLILGLAMAAVSGAFFGRRRRILQAVEDPDKLATELGIMISLSDKVNDTRGTLSQLAGGGGWRLFSRLKGVWSGVAMTGRWIDGIGDLPRARYFAPPKIGTTVSVAVASLWLIPISIVMALLALIASLASAL